MITNIRLRLAGYLLFCALVLLLPLVVGDNVYLLNKFTRFLTLGMVTMALSLSWGYCGILNLGQGVSFGLGAYAMAMHLKLVASASNPGGLPDFMGWNNVSAVPWFWLPFHSVTFSLIAGIVIPCLVAALLGWFMFKARIGGVFVAIITLAMLLAVNLLFIDQQGYTGGLNGMTDLAMLNLFGVEFDPYSLQFYYLVAGCLVVCLLLAWAFTNSKAGLILQAIRGNPERVRYFGYNVAAYETLAFSISAAIAGVAGMLYAQVLQFASPTFMDVGLSLAIVVWCAVGGRSSLVAAAIGAILINFLQDSLSDNFVDTYLLILGGVFVAVVLFLPFGLVGLVDKLAARKARPATVDTLAVPPAARPANLHDRG